MKEKRENPGDLLHGTLNLLVLKTLARGSMQGYGVAEWLHETSEDVLRPYTVSNCGACSPRNGAHLTTTAAPSITR